MSDFHLQQLAAASAAVPKDENSGIGIVSESVIEDATPASFPALTESFSENVELGKNDEHDLSISQLNSHFNIHDNCSGDTSNDLREEYVMHQSMIISPHDTCKLSLQQNSYHLEGKEESNSHSYVLQYQDQGSIPQYSTPNSTTVTDASLPKSHLDLGGHESMSQFTMDQYPSITGVQSTPLESLDLETRFQAKCLECNALRQELASRHAEIRRLKQDLYRKNKISHKEMSMETSALPIQGENITIDVDIGPSSTRTRSYDQRWKNRFQDLVKYKLTHGDCIVPKSYKDKGLHSWVRKQRILKKDFDLGLTSDESMTPERVNALNSIGFAWVVGHQSNDQQWEANFQQLVVFKSQYGHTRVPQSYDKNLHKWVLNQRCRRRLLEEKGEGKAKGMTHARIEKLDAISFSWSGKRNS
jgi:Helicase associated domain